jgi:hypothetical protein
VSVEVLWRGVCVKSLCRGVLAGAGGQQL